MRDLHAHGVPDVLNGDGQPALESTEDAMLREEVGRLTSQRRTVKRDQKLSEMAILLIDTARMIEPVALLVGGRFLRWATLGVASGLASYALVHPTWERAAIAGGFLLLSPLLWWRA